jgi:hypothetical protein
VPKSARLSRAQSLASLKRAAAWPRRHEPEPKGAPRVRLTRFAECPFFYHVQSLPLNQGMVRHPPPVSQRAARFEFNPNVAPTELVPVLLAGEGIVLARFGLICCSRGNSSH